MKHALGVLVLIYTILFATACGTTPAPIANANQDPAQYGIPFQHVPATSDIVMYEINPGAFSAAGNFDGITAGLDSIKSLGINTIWIMPIYPIGQLKSIGSPYCVRNYTQVNPNYGTLDAFRRLVSEAHARNIAVLLDWAANHTAWDNPWIQNKSWYTQDTNGNIISPPGTTWTDVADLNYDNTEMWYAMIKAMKFWVLTANVDGFRCDAADYVPYNFWKRAIDELHDLKTHQLILLAEGSRNDHFVAGFQMNFAWNFLNYIKYVFINGGSAENIYLMNRAEMATVPPDKAKLRFTTNHDESNAASPVELFNGKQGALAASVITICMQGVPLLYCGQEVGVSNKLMYSSQRPIDWTMNPDMRTAYRRILGFYNSSTALRTGELFPFTDSNVVAFTKTLQNEEVLVLVNCRNSNVNFSVPSALSNSFWINVMDNTPLTLGTTLSFQPYQFLILRK